MPRERIQCEVIPQFDVVVAWNRNGTVQVATTANDAAERVQRCLEESAGDTTYIHEGWHVDLGRHQVNELIRLLRRARDQAFGRDE